MKSIIEGSKYVYHSTRDEHISSILEQGITSEKTNVDSDIILNVLEDLGFSDYFPFSRKTANYCHIYKEHIEYIFNQKDTFNQDSAVVIVDITKVNSPIYVADMSMVTNLIDYQCAGNHVLMNADTVEEAIELYKESIYSIDSLEDIYKYDEQIEGHTELIVDGNIPPEAIVNTLS